VIVGDDRGQLKLIDLPSGAACRLKSEMSRARAILSIEATGGHPATSKKKKRCDDQNCSKKCYKEGIDRSVIESELTVGRSNGMIQAYDISDSDTWSNFLLDPIAVTEGLEGTTVTVELDPIRSLKLIGKIIYVKFLGGLYCASRYPKLKNALLIVSDKCEVAIVDWKGEYKLEENKEFEGLTGADAEMIGVPLRPEWFKFIDFKAKYDKMAKTADKKDLIGNGGEPLNIINIEEETRIMNESVLQDTYGESKDKPKQLLYCWKLSNSPDIGKDNFICCVSVDEWSGIPRIMVGGANMVLRVFDFTTGEPLFAPRNVRNTSLDLESSSDIRICTFLSSLGEGNTILVGTKEGEIQLYDMIDTERRPSLIMIGAADDSALNTVCSRPRRCIDEGGKSYLRVLPDGGFKTMGVAWCDFQGYGHVYQVCERPEGGIYDPNTPWIRKETKRRKLDNLIYEKSKTVGDIMEMKVGFKYMMKPVRGLRPWIGSPKAMEIHESGEYVAIASSGQRIWSFKCRNVRGSRKVQHQIYTTTNPTAMLISNAPAEK